jgi:hypothetical protein
MNTRARLTKLPKVKASVAFSQTQLGPAQTIALMAVVIIATTILEIAQELLRPTSKT